MRAVLATTVAVLAVAAPAGAVSIPTSVSFSLASGTEQTQKQVQEIPGYVIAETTTGYYYPERWTLQQLNVGVYQWVQLPAEFRRK